MNVAFVIDPPDTLKAYKDSSVDMMRALQARGHRIVLIELPDLRWEGKAVARALPIIATDDDTWYRADPARPQAVAPLAGFDAVMMRKDPPFDMEYLYATYLLEAAEQEGARVFNRPRAIRDHNEKMAIARFPQYIVPTLVTRDAAAIHDFLDEYRDIIVKPLDGMGGASVFRVREDDPNRNVIVETVSQLGLRSVMAQRFIPEIAAGDKRILIIAGEVVPFALARIPKAGETRGNLAVGGQGVVRPLSARDREIAEGVAPKLWAEGLLVVGIDIIGDYLTEVNVTSPTCFVEITEQSGFAVGRIFAEALERAVASPVLTS